MEFDITKPHCRFFHQMLQIPHGTYNEKAISDWVVDFAKKQGLRYIQDDMYNVIIYKNATKGYEDHPPVILQAHLDMVCEKEADSTHDFLNDPIKTEVVDGWLQAKGTTLGADDGTGVCYMLSILEGDTLSHPALECVFTVQEEVGLVGALNLKKEYFEAKRMINLDCGSEGTTMTTTAGGIMVKLNQSLKPCSVQKNSYQLKVSGLQGGHSGRNINKERANSIKLGFRVVRTFINHGIELNLVSASGGNKDNAIPRDMQIQFCTDADFNALLEITENITKKIKKEFELSDPDISIELQQLGLSQEAIDNEQTNNLIRLFSMLPTGLQASSLTFKDLPVASMNLASIKLSSSELMIRYSLRSALESSLELMQDQLQCFAESFNLSYTTSNHYPAWAYQEKSELREIFKNVYKNLTGNELKIDAAHGGTECGVFCQMYEDMDIVTCAPLAENAHTPKERLNLEAFDRTYTVLTELLKNL